MHWHLLRGTVYDNEYSIGQGQHVEHQQYFVNLNLITGLSAHAILSKRAFKIASAEKQLIEFRRKTHKTGIIKNILGYPNVK